MENTNGSADALAQTISIDKVGAAKSQLKTALRLFFDDGDEVSQHTLVGAAHGILQDLCTAKGLKFSDADERALSLEHSMRQSLLVSKGYATKVEIAVNDAKNYFKHADEDPESPLSFAFQTTHLLAFDAVRLLALLDDDVPKELRVFVLWFQLRYPEYIQHQPEVAADLAKARTRIGNDRIALKLQCKAILESE
jgi:hypothetical protein